MHWTLLALVLAPARAALGAAPPYAGAVRIAFHVQQAAVVAYPVGLAALALVVLLRRPAWPAFAVYGGLVAYLAASYPGLRGPALLLAYQRLDLAVVLFVAGAVVTWWWRRERPGLEVVSVLLLGGMQAGKLLARVDPVIHWEDFVAVLYLVAYGVIAVLHVGVLWDSRRPSSP